MTEHDKLRGLRREAARLRQKAHWPIPPREIWELLEEPALRILIRDARRELRDRAELFDLIEN